MAWGLVRRGRRVTVIYGGDGAFRASRGNFGLGWVQSKGMNQPRYARWSHQSAAIWADFAAELADKTGMPVPFDRSGGYDLHFREETLADTLREYEALKAKLGGNYPFDVLDRTALVREEPHIGPGVIGASCTIRTATPIR